MDLKDVAIEIHWNWSIKPCTINHWAWQQPAHQQENWLSFTDKRAIFDQKSPAMPPRCRPVGKYNRSTTFIVTPIRTTFNHIIRSLSRMAKISFRSMLSDGSTKPQAVRYINKRKKMSNLTVYNPTWTRCYYSSSMGSTLCSVTFQHALATTKSLINITTWYFTEALERMLMTWWKELIWWSRIWSPER